MMRKFDYEKWVNNKWVTDIIDYIAEIHEYKGRQDLYFKSEPEGLNALMDQATILSTISSNKIAGIDTTEKRAKRLILKKTLPEDRGEEEIMGYHSALHLIHENNENISITASNIIQLHKVLYQYAGESISGKLITTQDYTVEKSEDKGNSVTFTPTESLEKNEAIEDICSNYNQVIEEGSINPLLIIPIFIHDFLSIHPFNNGNGRMAHLLINLLLHQNGYIVGNYISLEEKIERTKDSYYDALEASSNGWYENEEDPTPLIKYLLVVILSAYKDFENRIDFFGGKLSALEQVRKAVEVNIGQFTKGEIMKHCPNLSISSVENSLKELVNEDFIERHGKGRGTYYTLKEK